jgi:hypothetical protein
VRATGSAALLLSLSVLMLAGVSCGSRGSSHKHAALVPWVDRPLRAYVVPVAKPRPYTTAAPLCRASQLRVGERPTGVATGHELEEFVFHNSGSGSCLLRGFPRIVATSEGVRGPLAPVRSAQGTFFGRLEPADIKPGGYSLLDIETGSVCAKYEETVYRDLVFELPEGGSVRAGAGASIVMGCGLTMSTFGLRPPVPTEPTPAPGTPGRLLARIRAPRTVRPGTTLHYVVTLANPTSVRVSLARCPGYTEKLYAEGAKSGGSFSLNCDSVKSIPAHERVRYEMEIGVPKHVAGEGKLSWSLDTPTGPSSAVPLQIVSS